ncbi:outer membrane lipid asymmetry maintenance protein MlaD [Aquaspirillum serpens]|uniref:outer membrane lipid asymmetry maintenance protein MlaD n=1 Tax=Aquaspirillum serpens TaxID=190 RepID=UPI00048986B3|nr:outer membrane lipid asymmetry maintenance protein MlaD [Aquaspirillum serpens]
MQRGTIDLWVGVFAVIGLGALLFLALKVANLTSIGSGVQSYVVYADFDNIGGLKVRAPVKAAGVLVGRVESIALDTKTMRARATLALNSEYRFSKDVSAQILTAGLLGEQYIGLLDGGDEVQLAAGDKIDITSSALVLEDLVGKFMLSFAEKPTNSTE